MFMLKGVFVVFESNLLCAWPEGSVVVKLK